MNKVILKGNVVANPEIKVGKKADGSDIEICSFRIAVNDRRGVENKADFFNCRAFAGTGKFIAQYFKKGEPILVEGRIRNDNYTDNNGQNRYNVEIVVEQAEFCQAAPKQQEQAPAPQQTPQYAAPAPQYQQPQPAPQYAAPAPQYTAPAPQPVPAPQYAPVEPSYEGLPFA